MQKENASVQTTDDRHICDYPVCSVRGAGHPLACSCRSGTSHTTGSWQVDAGFIRKTYPHKVSPECSCEIASTCQHRPCCYYGKTVPENVRSVLEPPDTIRLAALENGQPV